MADSPEIAALKNPLTREDLTKINDLIERAKVGIEATEQARNAGINVGDMEARLRKDLNALLSLRQTYFPGEY